MEIPEGFDLQQAHVVSEWSSDRALNACRFDPNGRYVFTGAEGSIVGRYALGDGAKTALSGGHPDTWVKAIAFSRDGARVFSGGCDGAIAVWETAAATPTPQRIVAAHKGWVRTLELSPDGTQLASAGDDGFVRLWNVEDGSLVQELKGHDRPVYAAVFAGDGTYIVSGDLMGIVKQWKLADGSEAAKFDAAALHSYNGGQQVDFGGTRALAISSDGKTLAVGGLHKATNPLGAVHEPLVLLFDWETRELKRQLVAEGITQGGMWSLRWLADGTLMGLCSGGSGGFLLFWNAEGDKDFYRFKLPNLARGMDLHPDGLQVATAHYDKRLRIVKLAAKASA